MPYDLTSMQHHLEEYSPKELALLLDDLLYDMVTASKHLDHCETLQQRYLGVMLLRNQFAQMDEELKEIWT